MTYNKGKGKGIAWIRAHLDYQGDDCLIWPYARDDKGYGILGYLGKVWKASRLMCVLVHGEPPSDQHHAAHSCNKGHTGCANQKHLSWKTPSENTMDAVNSGHYGFSSGGQSGKLRAPQVSEIKALVGKLTNKELGLIYNVHAETIAKIRRGQTWREVA